MSNTSYDQGLRNPPIDHKVEKKERLEKGESGYNGDICLAENPVAQRNHVQTYSWDHGHPEKVRIAKELAKSSHGSQLVVDIDTLIVDALFSQRQPKSAGRAHNVQGLAHSSEVDTEFSTAIYKSYEANKHGFDLSRSGKYLSTAKKMGDELWRTHSEVKKLGPLGLAVLKW